jgi:hypothetical protein
MRCAFAEPPPPVSTTPGEVPTDVLDGPSPLDLPHALSVSANSRLVPQTCPLRTTEGGGEIHRDVSSSQESSVKRSAYASVLMCGSLISSMIRAMSWSGFSKPDGKIALASWVACAASGSWSGKIPTQVTSAVRVPNGVARDGQSRGAEKA